MLRIHRYQAMAVLRRFEEEVNVISDPNGWVTYTAERILNGGTLDAAAHPILDQTLPLSQRFGYCAKSALRSWCDDFDIPARTRKQVLAQRLAAYFIKNSLSAESLLDTGSLPMDPGGWERVKHETERAVQGLPKDSAELGSGTKAPSKEEPDQLQERLSTGLSTRHVLLLHQLT